ncbi:MAG: hypothetical protein Aureis2KO_01460 [Aureisphaera sp.]
MLLWTNELNSNQPGGDNPSLNPENFKIDEKHQVDNKQIDVEGDDTGSPIRRLEDDILEDAEPGRETSGRSTQFEKEGGLDQAIIDFNSLDPSDVKFIEGLGGFLKTGKLEDGRHITVREKSSDGRPTLEIFSPKGRRRTKIRYNIKTSDEEE